jgi:cytochrome c2
MSSVQWLKVAVVLTVVAALAGAVAYAAGVRATIVRPSLIERAIVKLRGTSPAAVTERKIETALLPLKLTSGSLAGVGGIKAGNGGGLARAGTDIIVADRRGAFAVWETSRKVIRALALPPPPDNIAAYSAQLAARQQTVAVSFRIHDIEAVTTGDQVTLFMAHETFLITEQTTALAVSRITLSKPSLEPVTPWANVYTSPPLFAEGYDGYGSGGRILVEGGKLLLTVGDYRQDTVTLKSEPVAQNPATDFGKIISIDLATKAVTRLSMGHRNPQGLVRAADGTLYATEHGPQGGDKLNRIEAGRNYGWPYFTYGTNHGSYDWPPAKSAPPGNYTGPIFAFTPSIGISNLIEVTSFDPAWRGDLLVASLNYSTLYRLRLDDNRRVVYREDIAIGQRIRDLVELPGGRIVMWTDAGNLLTLSVDGDRLAVVERVAGQINVPELQPCWSCHHVGPTQFGQQAPSLSKIVGRRIASDGKYDRYSPALKARSGSWASGTWTEDNLRAFLTNPDGFAAGTAMSYRASSPAEAAKIVEKLKTLD